MSGRPGRAFALFFLSTGCASTLRQTPSEPVEQALHIASPDCGASFGALTARAKNEWQHDGRVSEATHRSFACAALRDNLHRDSREGCAPPPSEVLRQPLTAPLRIQGELRYIGIVPREYAYDLIPTDRGTLVEVRIQLKGPRANDPNRLAAMQSKLDAAAAFWTTHSPGHSVTFRFLADATDQSDPHFDVNLASGDPRTPYDVTWGEDWSWHLLAHEVGHMLGLDDEYNQMRKSAGHFFGKEAAWLRDERMRLDWYHCDTASLMCDSKGEQSLPQPYHYYVLLRRRFCRQGAS